MRRLYVDVIMGKHGDVDSNESEISSQVCYAEYGLHIVVSPTMI